MNRKRVGAVICGFLCLAVAAVHAEDGNKNLSMDSFKASITAAKEVAAKESKTMLAGYVGGNDPLVGKPSKAVEFVTLQGGKFVMGTDSGDSAAKPIHEVAIATFDMTDTLVTVEQYAECVIKGGCTEPSTGGYCNWGMAGRQRHPINCVSWDQADKFAKFKGARLPSESEWEYAATSGGQNQKYPWGNEAPTCDKVVMVGCSNNGTMPVCSKSAGNTKQGLCDMAGNVWQWVQDKYQYSYDKAPRDGSAFEGSGSFRVVRGGSFGSTGAGILRADYRSYDVPGYRDVNIGFRLARSRR
ncbi:MAG: formylglycine-generating enzyme family protein [Elusimicrobia bacterium]|nr:formylglycine-generating enzyme family protein [Elusimicrobiota bacterium]